MANKFWLADPEPHDYPAALDYLELVCPPKKAAQLVAALKRARTITKKSKDILRASRLPLLDETNIHVKADVKKLRRGEKLSPVLLVERGELIIADGYHRVCAIHLVSEDLDIPCRLVHA